jgi:hypothetical protein
MLSRPATGITRSAVMRGVLEGLERLEGLVMAAAFNQR